MEAPDLPRDLGRTNGIFLPKSGDSTLVHLTVGKERVQIEMVDDLEARKNKRAKRCFVLFRFCRFVAFLIIFSHLNLLTVRKRVQSHAASHQGFDHRPSRVSLHRRLTRSGIVSP